MNKLFILVLGFVSMTSYAQTFKNWSLGIVAVNRTESVDPDHREFNILPGILAKKHFSDFSIRIGFEQTKHSQIHSENLSNALVDTKTRDEKMLKAGVEHAFTLFGAVHPFVAVEGVFLHENFKHRYLGTSFAGADDHLSVSKSTAIGLLPSVGINWEITDQFTVAYELRYFVLYRNEKLTSTDYRENLVRNTTSADWITRFRPLGALSFSVKF
ncbi:MAG: hypothetical protein V4616_01405 [Bacteroidota bacterium]